jgi:pSer/pThr/pTyr-binding forkhead associated (FHA) protein
MGRQPENHQGSFVAKLTLSFKDRKLKVYGLPSDGCTIGRDPACAIVIDSLAVEPEHARIRAEGDQFVVEAANTDCTLSVNDLPLRDMQTLCTGDTIQIGKHSLSFSEDNEGTVPESASQPSSIGWLQIQSGTHLGRTIRLDKAFTRVGKPDGELAIIAHRDDGYYLSALQGEPGPQLNDQNIGDTSCRLDNLDRITIGELQLQFFTESQAQNSGDSPPHEDTSQQRRFSRIPFDVAATLKDEQQSWETELLDISLHGALIRTPQAFQAQATQCYRLAVHLEGGTDICMDVEIAHQENGELGLNCKDIDVDSITHLRRLVELNLGDTKLLERELSALG